MCMHVCACECVCVYVCVCVCVCVKVLLKMTLHPEPDVPTTHRHVDTKPDKRIKTCMNTHLFTTYSPTS